MTVNRPKWLKKISHHTDLPVWLVQLQSEHSPAGPGLSWGCHTRPPTCLCGGPAGLNRPPPPADGPTGSAVDAPAHAGPSPTGGSDAQSPGCLPVPGGQQTKMSNKAQWITCFLWGFFYIHLWGGMLIHSPYCFPPGLISQLEFFFFFACLLLGNQNLTPGNNRNIFVGLPVLKITAA